MLVHFKFYRCGYTCAKAWLNTKNLDAAVGALWKERPSTFVWTPNGGPKDENRLTIEEYVDEHNSRKVVI
jgi:hypothetical protein